MNCRRWREVLAVAASLAALCASGAEVEVPGELEPWRGWVMHGEEFRRCPFFAQSETGDAKAFVCAWPERLTLDLDARGGRFAQRWQVFGESWVELPGDLEQWPADVRVNGARAAVIARAGSPQLRLQPGVYAIAGTFRWQRRPEALAVPDQTGVVEMTLDGRRVPQPERADGGVWLGKRRGAEQQQQMEIQVYRRVDDEIPGRLTTFVQLQIAGEGREELLAPVLPAGFVPVTLESVLPARLENDGRLRVQVRAGSWTVQLIARAPGVLDSLRLPAGEGPWAKEEVWSFAANDRLRVVAIDGVAGIDPVQAGVPAEWRRLPAYRMAADSEMKLVERSRGLAVADENQLHLGRDLWLDFDHGGLTARDTIKGTMRQGWRLDMSAPQRLLSATAEGENLLVTKGAGDATTGVELRSPDLDVTAVSRIERDGTMSATGWTGRFASVNGTLNLPPGHRLLAAVGADEAPGSWLQRWRLLDLFLVLLVSGAVARLLGWPMGVIALVGLALTYHEARGITWLWVNVLVALVLAREAPEGRLKRIAAAYRNVSFTVLLLVLVPFVFQQVRLAIHPQLEQQVWMPGKLIEGRAAGLVVPAAAPAPAAAEPETPMELESALKLETKSQVTVTGSRLNIQQAMQRYAPGTLVQAGPGIPSWRYNAYGYSWSGPVDSGQAVRFVVLTPAMLSLWRIVGCVLLAALLFSLARSAFAWPRGLPEWARFGASGVLAAVVLGAAAAPIGAARADTPDGALLAELKSRLTRAPDCVPTCAEILSAGVKASGEQLGIELEVAVLAPVALPVPGAGGRWQPEMISVDAQPAGALFRDGQGRLWVPLRPGTHDIRLNGQLAAADSVQLEFPMRPRAVEVSADGWDFSGVNEGRMLTDTIELLRKRTASRAGFDAGGPFPAFVRVDRNVVLDLDWSIATTVVRLAPQKGALTLSIPLLPGESVLTPGVEVRDGKNVAVAMPAGESSFAWTSGLARSETLVLTLPENATRTETWRLSVSPQWSVAFDGTPAVLPEGATPQQWVFEYHPRAGERLEVSVTRPAAAEGNTLAIDGVALTADVGTRATNATLLLDYRSTQGGRHSIRLPADARVTSVAADGGSLPLRPDKGELTLALLPGEHHFAVSWQTDAGVALNTRSPEVSLRSPASNVHTRIGLPHDRWVLFAYGPGVGPAILIWSEIVVFVALALLIGRSRYSPLTTMEWLLLGLGLSTFSWGVLIVFAAWLFTMRWRESWSSAAVSRRRYNLRQILLALLSIVAILSLLAAIPNGLLGTPDMRIRSADGAMGVFNWFNDQTDDTLPTPGVISVSLWWYKAAMLAWALWLSSALLRWLPWAWRVWTKDGMWRGKIAVAKPS